MMKIALLLAPCIGICLFSPAAWADRIEATGGERLTGAARPSRVAQAQAEPGRNGQEEPEPLPRTQLRFLRAETVLLEDHHVEADFALSYLRNQKDLSRDIGVSLTGTVRANLLANLEGFASAPVQWTEREIALPQPVTTPTRGIGDVRFGLKYRLLPETALFPAVYLSAIAGAPTGEHPYLLIPSRPNLSPPTDIRDPFAIGLGSGHWSVGGSVAFLRTYDPIVLFAGFDYTHTLPETYYGVRIKPGDRFGFNLGLGFGISEYSTLGMQVVGGYERVWKFNGVKEPPSAAWPLSTRLSYTHRLTPKDFIEPAILFGLTDDTTDAVFTISYTRRF